MNLPEQIKNIDLDEEARIIKELHHQGTVAFIEIGERLAKIRARIPHGQWEDWVKVEFQWSERNARTYIALYKAFNTRRDLVKASMLPMRTLTLLASRFSHGADDLLVRAASGEKITYEDVQKTIVMKDRKYAGSSLKERIKSLAAKLRAKIEELKILKTEFDELHQLLKMKDRQLSEAFEEIRLLKMKKTPQKESSP